MNNCINCQKETSNPKYCCRSCSATYTNRQAKRKRTKKCAKCPTLVLSNRKYCPKCKDNFYNDWTTITIKDLQSSAKYQLSAHIRQNARKVFHKANPNACCKKCGYSLHVDVCHIHAIKDFPEDTPISVVNDLSNLVGLCKNHHWEFDNGHLTL